MFANIAYGLSFLWTIIIFVLCLLPERNFHHYSFWSNLPVDIIAHFIMFYILGTLVYLASKFRNEYSFWKTLIIVLFWCLSIGILTEIFQNIFTISRDGNIYDLLVDIAGTITAILSGKIPYNFLSKKIIKTN